MKFSMHNQYNNFNISWRFFKINNKLLRSEKKEIKSYVKFLEFDSIQKKKKKNTTNIAHVDEYR